MNGGLEIIKAILFGAGAAAAKANETSVARHNNKVSNDRYMAHYHSKEVAEVCNEVSLKHRNSRGEWATDILRNYNVSPNHAEAMLIMHELDDRGIKYDKFQIYNFTGYQMELDMQNGFYKHK